MDNPKKIWVAEVMQPRKEGETPFYLFHCIQEEGQAAIIHRGKPYLYSGNAFVRTDNPATAILIQQLLNEGQLTVKPFNPETNDLPK